jgi:hypothetical protein
VNHKPVSNLEQYRDALSGTGNNAVLLLVLLPNQQNSTVYMLIQP